MKVPISWLKEYVAIDMTATELADRLALTGTEVERVSRAGVPANGGNLNHFIIGQVEAVAPHPDADRLVVCDVDTGDGARKVVCGARNFQEGDKVAVCLPGGVLPDGRKLEAAEIRGVKSHGMMCSEAELGLSAESAGIMVLPEDASVGTRLADYISVSDEVLELEVTPNRPDCLSVYGVAREVAAVTGAELATEPVGEIEPHGNDNIEDLVSVIVADHGLCPRYGARMIAGVGIGPSPAWLKARLVAAGMRPVNNVVDITNYVMWTLGEPMHAFDLKKVAGGKLIVRRASKGEKITTIDGVSRVLTEDMLVIADGDKPTAVAGIMGSEASEVSDDTTDILLEAACFSAANVMATSMALGLRSESSTRFEKGLDIHLVPKALDMASRMIVDICGGRLVPGQIDVYSGLPEANVIHLRQQKVTGMLGIEVPAGEIVNILVRLGFTVESEQEGLRVTVPSFRADVEREVDLIEEIARVFGLDLIPPTLPSDMRVMGGLTSYQLAERDIARALSGNGLNEVITYTFIAPDFADRLALKDSDSRRSTVMLANPLSVEQSVMRTLMLPSLLQTVSGNLALGNRDVNIFELGRVYLSVEGEKLPDEKKVVAGCLCGSLAGESWLKTGRETDYFTGKGIVEAVFAAVNGKFDVRSSREPFLHTGKSADIVVNGEYAGYVGEVHPQVLDALDIDRPVVAFEIIQDNMIGSAAGTTMFEDLITYPASFQDIAVVVGEDTAVEEVLGVATEAGLPLLDSVQVFDIYVGDQIEPGKKSIALRLEFRSPERTLTDEEVDDARGAIVHALAEKLGATLRA